MKDWSRRASTSWRRPWRRRRTSDEGRMVNEPATAAPVHAATSAGLGTVGIAVHLEDIHKRFDDVAAVDGVNLEIREGEFFSMLGPSGSGKTTCLRMIAGFEQPTGGRILLDGNDVSRLAPYERDVNTVFQDYALFPHMTVGENVEYGLKVKRVDRTERRTRIAGRGVRTTRHRIRGGVRRCVQRSGRDRGTDDRRLGPRVHDPP